MSVLHSRCWPGIGLISVLLTACATSGTDTGNGVDSEPAVVVDATTETSTTAEAAPPEAVYALGGVKFHFPRGALLQTWPVMFSTPQRFVRLAVQMPAAQLAPDLAGIQEAVQIDLLEARFIPDPNATLQAAFADWTGRETAPAQSAYKFTITSQRGATGSRIAYLRQKQKIGLDSLAPFQRQEGAPVYLVALDDTQVTTLIECGPLPAAYRGGDHCSLRRSLGEAYGYRVLFPVDLLSYWQAIDAAARDYVEAARE